MFFCLVATPKSSSRTTNHAPDNQNAFPGIVLDDQQYVADVPSGEYYSTVSDTDHMYTSSQGPSYAVPMDGEAVEYSSSAKSDRDSMYAWTGNSNS